MPRAGNHADKLGGKLAPRVAQVVSQAMEHHLRRTATFRTRMYAEGLNEFFRGMSREKRQHVSPLLAFYLDSGELPAELEDMLRFLAYGQGELSELVSSLGLGNAVGTSILAGIQNYLAPLNQKLIEALPNSLLDPGTAAQAEVRGFMTTGEADAEAAKGGITGGRLAIMKELATAYPSPSELLTLWRRGLISEDMVDEGFARNAIAGEYRSPILGLKREVLGVPDAALAVLRGHITQAEGESIAAANGYDVEDFQTLLYNTGEPPGEMQMLEAYRRGFITDDELQKGVRQSRIRDEWIPMIEKLRFSPASAADAVNAVVQGHLDNDTAKQIAEWNGLRPEDWDWLVENAGNPMSNMQALELYNRGKVTKERVEESIREGRTKDKYIPDILELRVKLPPIFEAVRMIASGGISPARGAEVIAHQGYEPDITAGLVHAATSEQATKAKALAVSQIEELYEELALTEDEAIDHLKTLGFTEANAKLVLRVADLKRERKLVNAALTPVKSAYTARHISEEEASALMDKLGLPAAQRDLYLELWTIDREGKREVLTPEKITKALKLNLISRENAVERLVQHGYSKEDAEILCDIEV